MPALELSLDGRGATSAMESWNGLGWDLKVPPCVIVRDTSH